MSERAAMAGGNAPPRTIEHDGKTYTFRPVLDEGTMLAVEEALYDRELAAIAKQKVLLGEARFEEELATLRKRYIAGDFAFEHKSTMDFLKTQKGSMMLLAAIGNCTEAEIVTLMAHKRVELTDMLQRILALSMPQGTGPKPKGRRR